MAKLLAFFFEIEMFKATITRIVEKNHYQITSAFDIVELRWYILFLVGFSVYFVVIASKNLQKSSAIQNIYVTLDRIATILYTRAPCAIGWFWGNDLATVPFAVYCFVLLAKNSLSPTKIMIIPEQFYSLLYFFKARKKLFPADFKK